MPTALERGAMGPGTVGPSPGFLLHSGESGIFRLNPNVADFDQRSGGEPVVLLDIVVEISRDDGQTWGHQSNAQVSGGSRSKGEMPGVGVANNDAEDRRYRAHAVLNSRFRFGIDWEPAQ